MNAKKKVTYKSVIYWGGGILLLQLIILVLIGYYNVHSSKYVISKAFWSSSQGAPEERVVLDSQNNNLSYRFFSNYEQLDEFIVFFYHCAEAQSGKVSIDIEDDSKNSIYHYSFEPQYLKEDIFCLTGHPETKLHKGEDYSIVIGVEDIDAADYLEVGTSSYTQNRDIFYVEGEEVLFTKLEYTFSDISAAKENIWIWIEIILVIDYIILVFVLIISKKYKSVIAILMMTVGMVSLVSLIRANEWYNRYKLISHAMGRIDGRDYTNSQEAFELAYANGHKVFEVDFSITSDGKVVLKHDWENSHGLPEFEEGYIPVYNEFMGAKIWDKYTTVSLEELFRLMLNYDDIYIVTDSKAGKYPEVVDEFESLNEILKLFSDKEQEHIKNHLIIQLYNNDMYTAVESVSHFEHYIYTLYQKGVNTLDDTIEFCKKNDIPVVVMPAVWWNEEINETLHKNGLKVYLHTLNDADEANMYFNKGVDGIYTDCLSSASFR